MKILGGVLYFWMCISLSYADDAAEAIATVLDVVIKEHIDSSQVETGAGAALMGSDVVPEFHLGVNNYFSSRFKMGVTFDIPVQGNSDTPDFYIGAIAGIKSFSPALGRHFINFAVGGSKFKNTRGLYVEPSISFTLKESSAVKYFWIMHTFGVNASVAFRHVFIANQTDTSLETDAISLKLNLFMGQRERRY